MPVFKDFEKTGRLARTHWHTHCSPDRDQTKIGGKMHKQTNGYSCLAWIIAMALALVVAGCSGGPMTTREKAAGIGALGGAAAGGLIGAAVGHPGAGAAIGGGLGLGAGALVGDQLQGHEITNYQQQQQIRQNQAEIERQRQELQRLKRQQSEY